MGDYLTTPEAAAVYRINSETLKLWRVKGGGPRFVKLGRRVLYRREDLEAFAKANLRTSTSDPGPAAA